MMISVTPDVYVTCAKAGLNEDHTLILLLKYAPLYASRPVKIHVVIDMVSPMETSTTSQKIYYA